VVAAAALIVDVAEPRSRPLLSGADTKTKVSGGALRGAAKAGAEAGRGRAIDDVVVDARREV
jgi:hypothetical protein